MVKVYKIQIIGASKKMTTRKRLICFVIPSLICFFSLDCYCKEKADNKLPKPTYEPTVLDLGNGNSCSVLSRFFHQKPGPKVVLTFDENGKCILNPRNKVFPKSKDLSNLSYKDAEIIFGKPKKNKNGIKTFDLMFASQSFSYRMKHLYHIDTKFEDGKLSSYRLHGNGLSDQNWIFIN